MFQNAPGRDALSCSPAPAVPPPTGEASRRCPSLGRQRGPGARPAASAGSALRPPRGSSRRGAQTHQGEGEEPGTAAQTQKSLLCGHRLPVSSRQDRDGSRKKNLSGQFRTPASSPLVKSSGSQAGAALPLTGHSETCRHSRLSGSGAATGIEWAEAAGDAADRRAGQSARQRIGCT